MIIPTPAACSECNSTDLAWHTSNIIRTGVQQGRLNTNDVQCIFFLGCNHCSETLKTVSADTVASLMNSQMGLFAAADPIVDTESEIEAQ